MSHPSWKDTVLYREIQNRDRHAQEPEAEDLKAILTIAMPTIERILRSANTSPTDFTLHDDQHAFRVAQSMAQLIAPETLSALNAYELALLLLSAYLHDIGMTPAQRRV